MFESFLMIVFKHAAMRNMVERFRFCRDMLEKYTQIILKTLRTEPQRWAPANFS